MTERETLLIVLNIDGDERSARRQDFLKMLVADGGDTEEQIRSILSVAHFFELDRCCSGRSVPRRPASGQARPQAHVELSRGWLSPARGIS